MQLTFESVYNAHYKSVLRYLKTKIKDELICEELVNDVFIRVHKNFSSFDPAKSQIRTWLFHIAKNILIDHFRKQNVQLYSLDQTFGNLHGDDSDEGTSVGSLLRSDELNPEDLMILEEGKIEIESILSRLPDTHKEIANLYFFIGLSYEEIADSLNIPLGTMKARMFQVRQLLKTCGVDLTSKRIAIS